MPTALEDAKAGAKFDTWLRQKMEDAVPCAYHECDAEAQWRMVMPCCNKGVDFCDPHKKVQDDTLDVPSGRQVTCSLCGTSGVDVSKIRFNKI